jgi:hypothetical protein
VQTAQLTLFDEPVEDIVDLRKSRSGTFIDNMIMPVHRWFRYSAQHSSRERLRTEELLEATTVQPIRSELERVVQTLAAVRESHGGKKHYHTMVAAYCRDIGLVLCQLRRVCKPGSRMCWVIGDSAPYGVYCPIEKWIAEMAMAAGFKKYHFDKLRDRNIKWKNRKHRVPLKEGLLWIEG